jgi:hypothetical protein
MDMILFTDSFASPQAMPPCRSGSGKFAEASLAGSLPFSFNCYFVFVVPIFSRWMILDVMGWWLRAREERLRIDP